MIKNFVWFVAGAVVGVLGFTEYAKRTLPDMIASELSPMTMVTKSGMMVSTIDTPIRCREIQAAIADGHGVASTAPWGERYEIVAVACGSETPR